MFFLSPIASQLVVRAVRMGKRVGCFNGCTRDDSE